MTMEYSDLLADAMALGASSDEARAIAGSGNAKELSARAFRGTQAHGEADEALDGKESQEEPTWDRNACQSCLGRGILYWADPWGNPRNAWCDACQGTGRRRGA